jgi:hypothetical protein
MEVLQYHAPDYGLRFHQLVSACCVADVQDLGNPGFDAASTDQVSNPCEVIQRRVTAADQFDLLENADRQVKGNVARLHVPYNNEAAAWPQ